MKKVIFLCVVTSFLTSACTPILNEFRQPITKELRHPGGYPGHVLDKRMFDASDSKELQLLRATIILAMIARTGATSSDNREDAETFVKYTVAAVDEINILAGHIAQQPGANGLNCSMGRGFTPPEITAELVKSENAAKLAAGQAQAAEKGANAAMLSAQVAATQAMAAAGVVPLALAPVGSRPGDPGDPNDCYTYAVNFESDIKLLEGKLFKLALISLPRKAAKRLLDDVANGDVLGSVFSAARFALSSVDVLRSAAAVQRTGLEIQAWQKPGNDNCADGEINTVKDATKCLDLPDDTVFTATKVSGLAKSVPPQSMNALMRNIYDSCRLAPLDITTAKDGDAMEALLDTRIKACNNIQYSPRSRWRDVPQY